MRFHKEPLGRTFTLLYMTLTINLWIFSAFFERRFKSHLFPHTIILVSYNIPQDIQSQCELAKLMYTRKVLLCWHNVIWEQTSAQPQSLMSYRCQDPQSNIFNLYFSCQFKGSSFNKNWTISRYS